ncbi:unnamed protein product [Pleuronectes platessa]|uniref:Uncharacterized protein n=1 Tax=Pleuronectes platessa TaxID=8262 RepID=A0A9N7TYI3_PLEPL|nr:unnamed protein product [Pleuronectes platessa]
MENNGSGEKVYGEVESGLILLKISRECSGGGDERQWERERGEGRRKSRWRGVSDRGRQETEREKREGRLAVGTNPKALAEKVLPDFARISAAHLPIISPDRSISPHQAPPSI